MSRELRLRIIFGLLYAVSIVGFLFIGKIGAHILLIVLGLLLLWEFFNNSYLTEINKKVLSLQMTFFHILFIASGFYFINEQGILLALIAVSLIYNTVNIVSLLSRQAAVIYYKPVWFHSFFYLSLPILLAVLMNKFVPSFHWYLLYLFIVVWLCDVGAYFVGKPFGKKKLYAKISPNKTWEGFLGGGALGLITAVFIHRITGSLSLEMWIVLGIMIWVISVFGDLIESSFKRHYGIKDTGTFIPGHGGFLDRLDSFIFTLPFYAFFILKFAL